MTGCAGRATIWWINTGNGSSRNGGLAVHGTAAWTIKERRTSTTTANWTSLSTNDAEPIWHLNNTGEVSVEDIATTVALVAAFCGDRNGQNGLLYSRVRPLRPRSRLLRQRLNLATRLAHDVRCLFQRGADAVGG